MNKTLQLAVALVIGVSLAGCDIPLGVNGNPPRAITGGTGGNNSTTQADVTAQISVAGGSTSLVDHYVLTLQQNGTTVAMAGNPASLAAPAPVSKTFSAVPNGTNYTLVADAVDGCGGSMSTGAVTSAAFDIVDGAIVDHGTGAPLSTPMSLALPLLNDTLTVQVSGGGSTALAEFSLLNLANFTTTVQANSVAADPTSFLFSNVAAGATGGHSHELFHYFVDSGSNLATLAKPQPITGTCTGKLAAAPINLTYSMTQSGTYLGYQNINSALHTGGFGHAYYYDMFSPTQFFREDGATIDITNGGQLFPDVTAFAVAPINGQDTIFYYDGSDANIHAISSQGGQPTSILDLTGQVAGVGAVAVDAGGAVYFVGDGNVWKLPANVAPTFANAVEVINTGTVTDLAVDAFGNIFYVIGNTIYTAPLASANGTVYGASTPIVTASWLQNNISVDAVGNLYYQDNYAPNNLRMVPADDRSHVYGIAATAGVIVYEPAVGADGTLYYIDWTNRFQDIPLMKL